MQIKIQESFRRRKESHHKLKKLTKATNSSNQNIKPENFEPLQTHQPQRKCETSSFYVASLSKKDYNKSYLIKEEIARQTQDYKDKSKDRQTYKTTTQKLKKASKNDKLIK